MNLFKNKEWDVSIEQEFFSHGFFEKIFGFELFTFQYWDDKYPSKTKTWRLTVCSICLRIHKFVSEVKESCKK